MIFTGLVLLVYGVMTFLLMRTSDLLDREANELAAAGESIYLAEDLKSRLLIHNRNSFLYTLTRDPLRLESRRGQRTELRNLVQRLTPLVNNRYEEIILEDVERGITEYFTMGENFASSAMTPIEQYNQISRYVDATIDVIDRLILVNHLQMQDLVQDINDRNRSSDRSAVVLISLGSLILLCIIIGIVVTITRPLAGLSGVIAAYKANENSARAESQGLYEIRMIADSFNAMADYLEDRRRDQLQFIASIAHDFRNPLNAMSVAARLLLEKCPEETREITSSILRQVRNLDHLLKDLLDTTRIEAGQFELEFSVLDIGSLVRDAVALHRSWPVHHEIELDAPDMPLLCLGDESRLSQVLNNLLSNALKYSPAGSMIEVSAAKRGEEIILKVADQGIGIAGDERETIFMPFRRSAATRGTIPGIGLGLSASRRIVEAHGGRIEVESALGGGSTFTVHLPVHPDSRVALPLGGE